MERENYQPESRKMERMGREREKKRGRKMWAAFPTAGATVAGEGISPTVSFRNAPNTDVMANVCIFSARAALLLSVVISPAWNQEEPDWHINGPPWSPCEHSNRLAL